MPAKELLLELRNISVQYGGVHALNDVSIALDEGEIVALMGPNGAGKSTILKAFFGLAPLTHGEVRWYGKTLSPIPHEMATRGIAYVPQGRQIFKSLSVRENLELGGYPLPNRSDLKNNLEEVLTFFPALKEKLNAPSEVLSGGQQQMLTIARGLMSNPRVLMLDEPSLGLAPKIVKEVFEKIVEINSARKLAVLVVEHSIKSVLSIAHRAYVLSRGTIVLNESAATLADGTKLHDIFLK